MDNTYEARRSGATSRAFREKAGLRLGEASVQLGISYSYLANIEAGRKRLTPVLIARMAELYSCPQISLSRPDLAETGVA